MLGPVFTGVAAALLVAALSPSSAAGSPAVSHPGAPHGWYFSSTHTSEDGVMTSTAGTGGWVEDEVGGRLGAGSFLLEVEDASQRARLETTHFNRHALGDLTSFAWSASSVGPTGRAPSLTISIDPVGAEDFAVLVWEPGEAGLAVTDGGWQDWDTSAGPGWWSPALPGGTEPTDLATVVGRVGADSEVLAVAIDVGRHGPMTAHVDSLSVTTSEGTSSFDLEPDPR